MEIRIVQPHILLRKYIGSYSFLDYRSIESAPPARLRFPTDGGAEIIVNLGDPFYGGSTEKTEDKFTGSRFLGPHSRSLYILARGHSRFISIKFHPGRFRFFLGFPANEILDRSIPLEDLWSSEADEMYQKLGSAESFERMVFWLDRSFLKLVLNRSLKRQRIDELVDIIFQSSDHVIVRNLADHVQLSVRQMERNFQDIVGLTAKKYCRIRRFNRMLGDLPLDGRFDWADIAVVNGFSDQAHLTRDFSYFTGHSPNKYWSSLPPVYKKLISWHAKPPILPFTSESEFKSALLAQA